MKNIGWLIVLGLGLFGSPFLPVPAQAQLFNGPVDRLPPLQRAALRQGKVVLTGEKGKYLVKVLVTATPDTVWSVLTDCPNTPKFLPHLVSCQVLQTTETGQVIEQVSERSFFLITVRSRLRFTTLETRPQRIEFNLLEGDLSQMKGSWQLDLVAPYPGAAPNQVLITHAIEAHPAAGTPEDLFYDIFSGALKETLQAIRQEVELRSQRVAPN